LSHFNSTGFFQKLSRGYTVLASGDNADYMYALAFILSKGF
jgi:hypothetical protein